MATSHDMWTRVGFTGLGEWMAGMQAIRQSFIDGKLSYEEYSEALRKHTQVVMLQRREYMATRTAWRMEHQALLETMRAFRDVAGIGRLITSIFQTYTMMMLRVERQQRDVTDATREVADAQFGYNRMVRIFGETSVYAIDAHEKLMGAQLDLEEETKRLTEIQEQNRFGMIGIGLQSIEIAPRLVYLIMHVRLLQQWLAKSGGATYALTYALGSLKVAALAVPWALLGQIGAVVGVGQLALPHIMKPFLEPLAEMFPTLTPEQRELVKGELQARGIYITVNIDEINTEADYEVFINKLQRDLRDVVREQE